MKNLSWKEIIAKYQHPHRGLSIWQLVNTLVPYTVLWYLMYLSLTVSYWLTLGLAVVSGGLLVRIFIIFHDCGHLSFFKSQKVNRFWGFITGVLTFTPHDYWWHEHAQHHASAGNLDSRGIGDIWTMTVREYIKASRMTRLRYRLLRNPLCLFLIGPFFMFVIARRIPNFKAGWKKCRSTILTNIGIAVVGLLASALMGWKAYLLIQLPVIIVAASAGVWLFYWFTGNIGFHHIHHLSPRIPNYFLERCYKENPLFQQIKPITLLASFKSLKFRLWDEHNHQLISFGELKCRLLSGLIKV